MPRGVSLPLPLVAVSGRSSRRCVAVLVVVPHGVHAAPGLPHVSARSGVSRGAPGRHHAGHDQPSEPQALHRPRRSLVHRRRLHRPASRYRAWTRGFPSASERGEDRTHVLHRTTSGHGKNGRLRRRPCAAAVKVGADADDHQAGDPLRRGLHSVRQGLADLPRRATDIDAAVANRVIQKLSEAFAGPRHAGVSRDADRSVDRSRLER